MERTSIFLLLFQVYFRETEYHLTGGKKRKKSKTKTFYEDRAFYFALASDWRILSRFLAPTELLCPVTHNLNLCCTMNFIYHKILDNNLNQKTENGSWKGSLSMTMTQDTQSRRQRCDSWSGLTSLQPPNAVDNLSGELQLRVNWWLPWKPWRSGENPWRALDQKPPGMCEIWPHIFLHQILGNLIKKKIDYSVCCKWRNLQNLWRKIVLLYFLTVSDCSYHWESLPVV